MNPNTVLDWDCEWLDEDEEEEPESLGELFFRDAATGRFTRVDCTHLPHFVALYERDEDVLN
ncbi:MAG TPA: hypothetical protein VKA18_09210 [Alphaproteobacteria bacterium]|nr:hypothetical protein [Alphaproteobacteria bacterium]